MNQAPPSQAMVFFEAQMKDCAVGIQAVGERLSARDLETASNGSWDEYLSAFRKTSSVVNVSDAALEQYYTACRQIFAEQLALLRGAHWTVGSA